MSRKKIFITGFETLPEKIVSIRTEKNLSQEGFAKLLSYSRAYIADVESGRTKPSRKMLEAIKQKCGVSIDWLLSENRIIDLIEANKTTENPYIIFIYAFTQAGLDHSEKEIRRLLLGKKYILVNALNIKTPLQLFRKIFNTDGKTRELWKKLEEMMLTDEVILIIKNISSAKFPHSEDYISGIFKIMDDAWGKLIRNGEVILQHKYPKSSLIILDFPSYLEKNMQSFGYYAIPVYLLTDPWGKSNDLFDPLLSLSLISNIAFYLMKL